MSGDDSATTPRAPRPGDPFAQPTEPAPRPPRIKRKKGHRFFLFLLLGGGALVLASLLLVFTGRGLIFQFYKDFYLPRGIPEALPPDYPVEKARRLLTALETYFELAEERKGIDNDASLRMLERIETAMADGALTDEEVDELLALAEGAVNRAGDR